jgi:Mg-chelatase subunit ChlD
VAPLTELLSAVRASWAGWERLRWSELQFARQAEAMLLIAALLALPILVLVWRAVRAAPRVRARVALPAILPTMRPSRLTPVRHAAFLLFVLGIPFVAVAIADPRSSLVSEEVVSSGRQIAMLIDGSGSMILPFEAPTLAPVMHRAFYTAVAAGERFVRLRMAGRHADRFAIIQFGNEAYVVTPFTTDHENVLLSLRLIGEPRAWNRFNVFGTTIIQGIDQGLRLFNTFDLVGDADNMIVILSDGNDGETNFRGRTLDQMMADARKEGIPIFMVRLGYQKRLGEGTWDDLWKAAVERSGGRFYVAADEAAILRALTDIDRLAEGRTTVRRYTTASPAFSGFALVAVGLWMAAGTLRLASPYFRTFP